MKSDDITLTSSCQEDSIDLSSCDLDLIDWGDSGALSIDTLDLSTINIPPYTITASTIPNGDYIFTGTSSSPWVNISSDITNTSGQISLEGANADITINGRSLSKTIQSLEERLNMLRPNEHLEAEWDQLRELGDAYRKLEADLLEKQHAWEILKKQ